MKCSRAQEGGEGGKSPVKKAAAAVALGSLLLGAGALEFGSSPYITDCGCTGENAAVYAPLERPSAKASLDRMLAQSAGGGRLAQGRMLAMAPAPAERPELSAPGSPLPTAGEALAGARFGLEAAAPSAGAMRPFDAGPSARELLAAMPELAVALAPRLAPEPAPRAEYALPAAPAQSASMAPQPSRAERPYRDAPELAGRETERELIPLSGR